MLLETIKIINKTAQNLPFHQARFNKSRKELLNIKDHIDLAKHISTPKDNSCYKCRILYQEQIQKIELLPYKIRPIQSLRLVVANNLNYNFKYTDRAALNALVAQKGEADDILIIKNGWVTDTSYSNIVFWDGEMWWTPDTPLLAGTQRTKYLKEGIIKERAIRVEDLKSYSGAKLLNAMMDLEDDTKMIQIENLIF